MTASGDVGIGTASPSNKLGVSGDIRLESQGNSLIFAGSSHTITRPNTNELRIGLASTGAGNGYVTMYVSDGSSAFESTRFDSSGNVGIGTTTPGAKLSVDGRGVFNQDISANYYTATSTTVASTFPYAS